MAEFETSFLDEYAGEGINTFTQGTVSTPWLSIMQDRTQHVIDGLCEAGVWRNSATGDAYGKTLEVVPVAFKVIWNERDDATGKTVANYEPNSIEVEHRQVKGRSFTKMINPNTGNTINETFLYAVVLPSKPEIGVCLIQANMGSMGTFKRWNALLRAQMLPSGAKAPIFAYSWKLGIGDKQAKNANGQAFYRLEDVQRGSIVTKELFDKGVAPNRKIALTATMALAAPEEAVSDMVEE